MAQSLPCIEDILRQAEIRFVRHFGSDENERSAYKTFVVPELVKCYSQNPRKLERRLFQIIDLGLQAYDLGQYLRAACVAEGKKRPLTYREILTIIGEKKLSIGDLLYHFSATQHPIGFRGHKGMCFTNENDIDSVSSDAVDPGSRPIYVHHCEVLTPEDIWDHEARALRGTEKEEIIFSYLLTPHPSNIRWYEAKKKGAIQVVFREEVKQK